MLECACSLMTRRALPGVLVAEGDGVLELTLRCRDRFSTKRLIDSRVAHRAVVANYAAVTAGMLAVVTPETTLGIIVADFVWMRLPVSLHLGEEIGLINTLDLSHGG